MIGVNVFSSPVSDFIDAIREDSKNPKPYPYKIGLMARLPYDSIAYKIHFHIGKPEEPIIYQVENPHWKSYRPEITLGIDNENRLTFYEGRYRGCVIIRQGQTPAYEVLNGIWRYSGFTSKKDIEQEDPQSFYLDFYRHIGTTTSGINSEIDYYETGKLSYVGPPVMSIRVTPQMQSELISNIYSGYDEAVGVPYENIYREASYQITPMSDVFTMLVFNSFQFRNFKK